MLTPAETFKEIFEDIKSVIRTPTETFTRILNSPRLYYSKVWIVFIIFMNTYYLFLPSNLVTMNIIAIVMFFLAIGFTYYFMQEVTIDFKEARSIEDEDKSFYKVAYAFSIANAPALFLNVLNNFLCLLLTKNLIVGVFFAGLISVPISILGLVYVLKVLKVISHGQATLQDLVEVSSRSFITTLQETLGLRAIQELIEDFKAAP